MEIGRNTNDSIEERISPQRVKFREKGLNDVSQKHTTPN